MLFISCNITWCSTIFHCLLHNCIYGDRVGVLLFHKSLQQLMIIHFQELSWAVKRERGPVEIGVLLQHLHRGHWLRDNCLAPSMHPLLGGLGHGWEETVPPSILCPRVKVTKHITTASMKYKCFTFYWKLVWCMASSVHGHSTEKWVISNPSHH